MFRRVLLRFLYTFATGFVLLGIAAQIAPPGPLFPGGPVVAPDSIAFWGAVAYGALLFALLMTATLGPASRSLTPAQDKAWTLTVVGIFVVFIFGMAAPVCMSANAPMTLDLGFTGPNLDAFNCFGSAGLLTLALCLLFALVVLGPGFRRR